MAFELFSLWVIGKMRASSLALTLMDKHHPDTDVFCSAGN